MITSVWSCKSASFIWLFYMKLNSFIADFKSFCIVILLGALQHTEFSNKLVFLCSFSYFERINKISKIDKIDTMDLKIDKYRLLTTFFFIDFHRFPIKSTVFIDLIECCWLSLLSIGQAGLNHNFCGCSTTWLSTQRLGSLWFPVWFGDRHMRVYHCLAISLSLQHIILNRVYYLGTFECWASKHLRRMTVGDLLVWIVHLEMCFSVASSGLFEERTKSRLAICRSCYALLVLILEYTCRLVWVWFLLHVFAIPCFSGVCALNCFREITFHVPSCQFFGCSICITISILNGSCLIVIHSVVDY